VRRYDDPVEVRKGADEDPDQFLWRGRLWQVREVVAHWVETGAWWNRRSGGAVGSGGGGGAGVALADTDLLAEREVWRVTAARGRVAAQRALAGRSGDPTRGSGRDPGQDPDLDLGYGVFDLVFSWSEGSWQLVRAAD
jgi:hypothetical protein